MTPAAQTSLNLAWVLLAGFLVMFMQVGFAMVETGFTRAKNAVHTVAMNLLIYPIGVIGYWLLGFGLMYGGIAGWPSLGDAHVPHHELTLGRFGLLGAAKFALVEVASDPAHLAMFVFGTLFM